MVNKRNLFLVLLIFVMSMLLSTTAMAQLKIGYVDSQQILTLLPSATEARDKLEQESNTWRQELQGMEDELRSRQEQMEQQSMLLSDAKKQEKAEEFQALLLRAQQYQNVKWGDGGDFFKRQAELLQPVYDQINEAIKSVRQQDGYDFILDSVNLLDAKEEYNLTDKVLKALGVESSS